MKSLLVPYEFERDEASSLMIVTFQDLSKTAFAQRCHNFVPVRYVVMHDSGVLTAVVIVAMIQVSCTHMLANQRHKDMHYQPECGVPFTL